MYRGEPSKGLEFYNLLIQSVEFTSELGRITLASGRLETELIAFLRHKGIEGKNKKPTLGTLIRIAQENQALDINMINALQQVSEKRNYLTHNIYALFSDMIDETILEKENLLDSDVHLYLERAWQLKENLNELTDILRQGNK